MCLKRAMKDGAALRRFAAGSTAAEDKFVTLASAPLFDSSILEASRAGSIFTEVAGRERAALPALPLPDCAVVFEPDKTSLVCTVTLGVVEVLCDFFRAAAAAAAMLR